MTKEAMIKVLRYKAEHIKTKIKPEFFSEVADALEREQRPKGHWILKVREMEVTDYCCSECGRYVRDDTGYDVSKDYPFCHCGADMREVTE